MTILQKPDTISLLGNLANIIILADEENVSFLLKQNETMLFQANYTPNEKKNIEINVRDIVGADLKAVYRDLTEPYEQLELVKTYTAEIGDSSFSFTVIKSGVDRLATSAVEFLKANWLTWQPQTKKVTYYLPECLTYYAIEDCVIKVKSYIPDPEGGYIEETLQLLSLVAGKVYTVPVQYAVIVAKLNSRMPAFYDVWVETPQGGRLSYIQRYVVSGMMSEDEQWVIFENSLGGFDTFRAYGQESFTAEHEHQLAEINEITDEYNVDIRREYKKNTGYLSDRERKWLLDFFPSGQKYLFSGNYLRRIVVIEDEASYICNELPSSYTFSYRYADAKPYLNLSRVEELPSDLSIDIPDLGSFTIPPRLVEFPSQNLTEGVLLPVQNPFSEKWSTTTIGAILAYVLGHFVNSENQESGGLGHSHVNYDLLKALITVGEYLTINGQKIKAGYADVANGLTPDSLVRNDFISNIKDDVVKWHLTFEKAFKALSGAVFGENKATITSEGRGILRELLVEVQAEINRLLVSAGAKVRNGLLADLITVQNGLLQTIISPEGIRTATAAVTGLQAETINNDGESAVLHGNKADFKGPVGSKSYSPGTEGVGWNVDPHGNAWFNSIHLRGFLDVPELRHNRVTVITDEQWSAPGGGIIESADTEALILTLKLEEGEAAALEVDDICKGIFHSGAGFSTCFFRITEVLGESTFRYTLRSGYAMHPMTAMDFVAYGNFTNPDRQKSAYTTREYTRYLKDVNDWDITERNIVMMMGNLDGMRLNGMDMSGYSAFLRNIYMTGTIRQMSGAGVTETLVPAWKGEWKAGTYYKNDEVTHNGATWLCISDEPTTQEPSITVTDWLQTVSEGKDAVVVSVYSTNGLFFQNGQGETELYAVVRQGDADITSSLPAGRFSWQRSSRNTDADALWNKTHEGLGPRIRITPYDVEGRSNFDCIVTI